MKQIVLWVTCTVLALAIPRVASGQNVWEPANGAPFGTVRASAVRQDGSILALTDGGTFFVSSDTGRIWSQRNDLSNDFNSQVLIWVSEGEEGLDSKGRIIAPYFKSGDTLRGVYQYVIGIQISSDEGVSWQIRDLASGSAETFSGIEGERVSALYVNGGDTIVAGTTYGNVFEVSDSVVVALGGPIWYPKYRINSVTISPDGSIYAAMTQGLYRYRIGGWESLNSEIPDTDLIQIKVNTKGALFALSGNLVTYNHGIFRSLDGGDTWHAVDSGLHGFPTNIAMAPDDRLLVGTWAGFFVSTDQGTHWRTLSYGLPYVFEALWAGTHDDINVSISSGTLFSSSDRGNHWVITGSFPEFYLNGYFAGFWGFAEDETNYYVNSGYGGFCRSTDFGKTWSQHNIGLDPCILLTFCSSLCYGI
ncbi:MAG: hypothetical protein Q8922_12915 [Bacteroidota bacterium]|nr:hypothetical protein [Bacteroidota bacterium]